jgi:hypothetical protein
MDRLYGTEGFSTQSKWLYLFSAVLIEVDEKTSIVATCEISGIILASLRPTKGLYNFSIGQPNWKDLGIGD